MRLYTKCGKFPIVVPKVANPKETTKEPTRMQKQRAFIRASSSSIPHLHQCSGKMPEKKSVFSPEQRFYGFPGRFGRVMAVALADWLCLGVVGRVMSRGFGRLAGSRGGGCSC